MNRESEDAKIEYVEDFDFSKAGPVLIIDDDQSFRTILQDFLKKKGITVVACESANHALKFISRQPWNWHPWLVITDLVMNGMGGFQFLRRLKEVYPQRTIPVIVVTRLTSAEDISEAELAGAAAYLSKPLQKERLLSLLALLNGQPYEKSSFAFTHDVGQSSGKK